MARPHPSGSPFAALEEAGASITLSVAVAEAARAWLETRGGRTLLMLAVEAARDVDLREVWDAASDGGRRDVLTTVAQVAAQRVDRVDLQVPDAAPPEMRLAATIADGLVELAVEELATPGRDPERSLLPDAPWEPATGPTGIYAMSTVCDSSEPETAKLAAAVALSAAAQRVGPRPS